MDICGSNVEAVAYVQSGRALKNVLLILNGVSAMGTEPLVRWSIVPSACLTTKFMRAKADPCKCDTKVVLKRMLTVSHFIQSMN